MKLTIQSIDHIEDAMEIIKDNIEEKSKTYNIQIELEVELGFAQWEHLLTSTSLEDFEGLSEMDIQECIERGLNNPQTLYPRKTHVTRRESIRNDRKDGKETAKERISEIHSTTNPETQTPDRGNREDHKQYKVLKGKE